MELNRSEAANQPAPLKFTHALTGTLTLESRLKELEMDDCQLELSQMGGILYDAFKANPFLPGVILTAAGQFQGIISRRNFLEMVSRQHGRELFLRRPIAHLYDLIQPDTLILPAETLIADAACDCLRRSPDAVYEPLVVSFEDQSYRLLDLQKLLIAKAEIYQLALETLDERNLALGRANLEIQERTQQLAKANRQITALNRQLQAENLRMSAELDVARQIQQMILPKPEELEAVPQLDIAGFMEPAAEVGGDYYDVLYNVLHEEGVVTIGIGDVTGHGLESGILMLMTQTAVRTLQELRESDPVRP